MKCNWCHSPILDEDDARNINDEYNVHWWCVAWMDKQISKKKDQESKQKLIAEFMKKMGMAVLIVAILACTIAMAFGQDAPKVSDEPKVVIPIAKAKKACTFVVGFKSLSVYYEKVLVVAEKPAVDEDGKPLPEWWIVNVENPDRNGRDAEGRIKAYNVPKEQVLFASSKDGPVMVMHHMRICKCPPTYWGTGGSGISAEH